MLLILVKARLTLFTRSGLLTQAMPSQALGFWGDLNKANGCSVVMRSRTAQISHCAARQARLEHFEASRATDAAEQLACFVTTASRCAAKFSRAALESWLDIYVESSSCLQSGLSR